MKTVFLVLFVFCFVCFGHISAAEIPVTPGTDVISAALANTYPGDVIVLEAGTYVETKTINTPPHRVTIRGMDGRTIYEVMQSHDLTVFDNDDKRTVAILVKGDFIVENIIFKTDGVGRCIVNAFGAADVGQEHTADKNSIFVDHCEFHNFVDTNIWIPDPAVMLDGKAHPIDTLCVTNSLFYDGGYQAIRGEYEQTRVAKVQNCTFWKMPRENIKIYGHHEIADYFHYLVDHCTFYDGGSTEEKNHGVYFKQASDDDTIRNCIVYKLAGVGITGADLQSNTAVQYCIGYDCGQGVYNSTVRTIMQLCLEEDPMFNDPDNGDFSLKEGSLAIGWSTDGSNCGNPITDWTHVITSIENQQITPASFELRQNYPNPFNPSTKITYSLERTGQVSLDVYNLTGQKIRTLVNRVESDGSHSVDWNGLDDHGRSVSGGIYFYRLKIGSDLVTKKMVYGD